MADPVVTITNGVPTSGTGTITTLGAVVAALPAALAANGGLKIEGVAGGTAVPVSVASLPSQAVTNAGTFAVQAASTLAAETTKVIGTVNVAASQTIGLAAGSAAIGKLAANSGVDIGDVDVTTIGGQAPAFGSGATGSTVLRTTLATDSPGIITVGTAGSASTNVVTVQGVASMTPVTSGGVTITQAASSTITRPADTTAYASGDLVANSTTAGSVAALQFTTLARVSGGSGIITGARIQKSTATTTSAAFRIHYFSVVPTFTSAGDNSAISTVVVASAKGYLGYVDITAMTGFSDCAWGTGAVDNSRGGIPFVAAAQIIYAIVEARGAYTPTSAEVFTVSTFALQD